MVLLRSSDSFIYCLTAHKLFLYISIYFLFPVKPFNFAFI